MEKEPSPQKSNFITDKLILAPMVRINTLPFRQLVYNHGCDITFTEEIIAKKLMQCTRKINDTLHTIDFVTNTENLLVLRTIPSEKSHLILQLGASNPDDAVKAATIAKDDIIGIDLNMGCPKHFSTHGNMGSSLLNLPELAKDILVSLVKNFPDKIISCKIRLLNEKEKFENLVKLIQESGIDYFTIHLRYKEQNSKYPAKWNEIDNVFNLATIPFVVNGDIFTPKDIQRLKKMNKPKGFMIGRGGIHNPNLFNEYKNLHEDLDLVEFANDDINNNSLVDKEISNTKAQDDNKINDNMQISTKLTKVLEKKYNNKKIEIISLIKEFLSLCFKYDNVFGNTKYIILYILKTHRIHSELFKKVQNSKNYSELVTFFNIEKEFGESATIKK